MLLISSLILSGCGPEPEDKESQQQQPSTPSDQQVLVAQQAAIKEVEQSAAAAKAAADAKALAQQEVQQYSDKQTLQGSTSTTSPTKCKRDTDSTVADTFRKKTNRMQPGRLKAGQP